MTLEARHLSRALSIKGDVRVLINDVSLTLEAGEVLGLTGPSGSGKSTLLRVLMGLDARSAGEVLLDGEPIRAEALPTFRRVVAMLSQTPALPEGTPSLTAQDLGLELDDHLEPLGLASSDLDTPWNKLSGGEARRVRLALLVATGPRYLILDEPSSGLDTGHVAMLAAFLRSQAAAGRGILVVSHDELLLARCATRMQILFEGESAGEGTPAELIPAAHAAVQPGSER